MALNKGVNSYATFSDANDYFADNLRYDSWKVLSSTVKSRALVTASLQISGVVVDKYLFPIDPLDIPADLVNATSELALAMVLDPAVITQANAGSNVKTVKAGSAEIEYFNQQYGELFPTTVMRFLKAGDYLGGLFGNVLSYSSGTDADSSFAQAPLFPLNRGY